MFDTVNHKILLTKMEQYGIREVPLRYFASYLTNIQQYVQFGNTVSSTQTITCGIPQGSSRAGSILLLIFINDLPNCSNILSLRILADDANVFATAKDLILEARNENNVHNELFNPIRPGFFWEPGLEGGVGRGGGGGGRRRKVPATYNSETFHGIEMKFGRVVENHKLINLV